MADNSKRPNIVFLFADDWGRYASAYRKFGSPNSINHLIETPNFDRIASEGALFTNAHVPAPTCTPCRSSILSGTYFWETGLGAILEGAYWDESIPSYPLMLEEKGYHIGHTYKVWSPGKSENAPYGGARTKYESAGNEWRKFSQYATYWISEWGVEGAKEKLYDETRNNFKSFLDDRAGDDPFCYWWGPVNTHRPWHKGSGKELWSINPDDLEGKMPEFVPDVPEVREDFADYLGEILAVDAGAGVILDELEKAGELDNTLVVMSGDHGIPGLPRAKCNLYDFGSQVALAARWPGKIKPGKVVNELVNLMSWGPTFLEAAGENPTDNMVDSIMPLLTSDDAGIEEGGRVIFGRERHVAFARQGGLPYPSRGIRTKDYLYIRNFEPDRYPIGELFGLESKDSDPEDLDDLLITASVWNRRRDLKNALSDMDTGPSKAWVIGNRNQEFYRERFDLAFNKRPALELYDVKKDPNHMTNLAEDPKYKEIMDKLNEELFSVLEERNDPRVIEGDDCKFEHQPYAGMPDPEWYTSSAMNGENWDPYPAQAKYTT